jgi:integrase
VLEDGTRRSLYARTRQGASRLLADALRDKERGLTSLGDRQTVEQYLVSWLGVCKHTVKPGTWRRYRDFVRLHIVPAVGTVALAKLTAQHVQALYARKLDDGLAPATVRQMHAVLHKALQTALRLGLVQRNVADMVDAPRIPQREMAILSETQVQRLLEVAAGDHLEALYVVALATGMRLGELLALRWKDVDLEAASLQVRATLKRSEDGTFVFAEPKTIQSRRRVALPATAAIALQRHRVRQREQQVRVGHAWPSVDLVFPAENGEPLDGISVLRSEFYPLLQRADLPRVRFHDLRHTAATLLLSRGVDVKVVSEMLGHSTIAITLAIYYHVRPHKQQEAADVMDRLLRG